LARPSAEKIKIEIAFSGLIPDTQLQRKLRISAINLEAHLQPVPTTPIATMPEIKSALRFLPWGADEAMLSALDISLSDARLEGLPEVMLTNERGECLVHIRGPCERGLDETLLDLKNSTDNRASVFVNKLARALAARLERLGGLMTTSRETPRLCVITIS